MVTSLRAPGHTTHVGGIRVSVRADGHPTFGDLKRDIVTVLLFADNGPIDSDTARAKVEPTGSVGIDYGGPTRLHGGFGDCIGSSDSDRTIRGTVPRDGFGIAVSRPAGRHCGADNGLPAGSQLWDPAEPAIVVPERVGHAIFTRFQVKDFLVVWATHDTECLTGDLGACRHIRDDTLAPFEVTFHCHLEFDSPARPNKQQKFAAGHDRSRTVIQPIPYQGLARGVFRKAMVSTRRHAAGIDYRRASRLRGRHSRSGHRWRSVQGR